MARRLAAYAIFVGTVVRLVVCLLLRSPCRPHMAAGVTAPIPHAAINVGQRHVPNARRVFAVLTLRKRGVARVFYRRGHGAVLGKIQSPSSAVKRL